MPPRLSKRAVRVESPMYFSSSDGSPAAIAVSTLTRLTDVPRLGDLRFIDAADALSRERGREVGELPAPLAAR